MNVERRPVYFQNPTDPGSVMKQTAVFMDGQEIVKPRVQTPSSPPIFKLADGEIIDSDDVDDYVRAGAEVSADVDLFNVVDWVEITQEQYLSIVKEQANKSIERRRNPQSEDA